jgi:uncharacterized caspase-like protein
MAKKALLVGINKYPNNPLNGCVNDVLLMESVLSQLDFTVQILVDNNATKVNILRGLEALFKDSEKDDCLVFHYSGHGSQVPDISGDEEDGLDECLLPIDFSWDNVILDDDINALLQKHVNGAHVEIILDACHSGSGTRNVLLSAKPTTTVSRFVQPPREIFRHITNAVGIKINNIQLKDVVTWSGCKDNQTSADACINGMYNGAFTFALAQSVSNSRKSTLQKVRTYMKAHGYDQIPQLTCETNLIGCAPFTVKTSLLRSLKFW